MKLKLYIKHKWNKSRNYDKGYGCYTVYHKGFSIDVFGVYSPKAAIRRVLKLMKYNPE